MGSQITGGGVSLFTQMSSNLWASRSGGVVYQNTGGAPMMIIVSGNGMFNAITIIAEVGVNNPPNQPVCAISQGTGDDGSCIFLVPPGHYYELTLVNCSANQRWFEFT